MANKTSSVRIGACGVAWGGLDLGFTDSGVDLAITTTTRRILVDSFGTTMTDDMVTMRAVIVKVGLSESDVASLKTLMGVTQISDLTYSSGVTQGAGVFGVNGLSISDGIGTNLPDTAMTLLLTPLDGSEQVEIPLASLKSDIGWSYSMDKNRVFTVEFVGYPDALGRLIYFNEIPRLHSSTYIETSNGYLVDRNGFRMKFR